MKITYGVKVSLSDSQAAKLAGGDPSKEPDAVQALAQMLVSRYADGGFVLAPAERSRIEKITGPLTDGMPVVHAVEASGRRNGDNIVVSIILDPIYVGELEEKARILGQDVDRLVSDLFNQSIHMGMFFDMQTDRLPVVFSEEQTEWIRKKLAVDRTQSLTSNRIAKALGWADPEGANPFEEPAGATA